jgi:hypothetical protein
VSCEERLLKQQSRQRPHAYGFTFVPKVPCSWTATVRLSQVVRRPLLKQSLRVIPVVSHFGEILLPNGLTVIGC